MLVSSVRMTSVACATTRRRPWPCRRFAGAGLAGKSDAGGAGKLELINSELANYADSKGYLSDGGQKAKLMEPSLDAVL